MRAKVQAALDELRPYIQADGGDVELVSVVDGVVTVRLTGHCVGCPSSSVTLKAGIETHLRKKIPDMKEVRQAPAVESTAPAPDAPKQSPFAGGASATEGASKNAEPITATLRATHRKAEALMERLEGALKEIEKGKRDQQYIEVLEEMDRFLKTELHSHMHQEDEVLFPALIPYISWGSPMSTMAKQHDILHSEIDAFGPAIAAFKKGGDPEILVRLARRMVQRLKDDFYQEENVLFVEADDAITGARASALREAMDRIAAADSRESR